jgi:hypothetical protein
MRATKRTPALVARETGYSYGHVYQVFKGVVPVTAEFVGRLLVTYGVDGPALAIADVMRAGLAKASAGQEPKE